MLPVFLLLLGIFMSGTYSVGLKPVNTRCTSMAQLQLFNGCFTCVAALGSTVVALIGGSFYIPLSGVLTAAAFGVFFSLCVFTNLKALEDGPVSLTTLIVNFSLIMPLIYSFCFLGEAVTVFRIVGILLLVVCMFLFTNPKITGEKKLSPKWLGLSLFSMVCNGTLSLVTKVYAIETDNAYSGPYLALCYIFASITSFVIFAILNARLPKEEKTQAKTFFVPRMLGLILLIGIANFGLNYVVVLLCTMMDGAIVYPAIQGGAPIIAAIGSRLFFGESISLKKGGAILLGAAAIVLLNL